MFKDSKSAQMYAGFGKDERPKGDFYATTPIAIEKLLDKENFGNLVLEPCCGDGAISKILEARGFKVISRDLYDWGYGESGRDFLAVPYETPVDVEAVITNPPFKLSLEFAVKGLECVKYTNGKVALLNRVQWLEGIKRKPFFEKHLTKVLVFSKRLPRMHRFDFNGTPSSSMVAFAWFIFENEKKRNTELEWV